MAAPRLEPEDAQTAAEMLAQAAGEGRSLVVEGGGTKRSAADAPDAGVLSSRRLTHGLSHYAGDIVATVPAGATLAGVNAALSQGGQWLPLDPCSAERATIGGIVASNDSGPRRHRFGSPRDLIIGIEVALPSGRVAHSGGRVVKNVAGYDLSRLFCGSQGSLGVITSATFKLAPLPPASRTVEARFATVQHAAAAAAALAASPIAPSAVELIAPEPRLLVRFETTERAATHMAASAVAQLCAGSADVVTLDAASEDRAWHDHAQLEARAEGLVVAVSVLPTAVPATLEMVATLAARCGLAWSATGRVALGLLRVRVTGDDAAQWQFAAALRTAVGAGGHVQFPRGTRGLASTTAANPMGSAAGVALAVKQRFDPHGVLPYPWSPN